MQIRITRTKGYYPNNLRQVINELSTIDGPMVFREESYPLMFEQDEFAWDEFFKKCSEYRKSKNFDDKDFLIVLTELRNDANWFAGYSEAGERTIFIHAADWENYIFCESTFPIAYEVIANVLQSLVFAEIGEEVDKYFHEDPIGCLNDMCGWKPDITFKLRTGDVCDDCLQLFSKSFEKEIIKQSIDLLEYLRKNMVFNKTWQKPMSFEENLPFTIAITKRKLGTTLEPFRKMLMLLDHFDSIVRTAVLMIARMTKSSDEMKEFLRDRNLHNLPSLGNWVDALAALANENREILPNLQLPIDFSNRVREVVQLANDERIVYIRNEKRGHGYIECHDSGYKELFQKSIKVIEDIEKLLNPLFSRYKYYHIISQKRIEAKKFEIKVHVLSGSNPTFTESEITTEFQQIENLPIENRVYLVTPDSSKWIDLNPYFKYDNCTLCGHPRLLVYDGIYMLDPFIGHRFKIGKTEACS